MVLAVQPLGFSVVVSFKSTRCVTVLILSFFLKCFLGCIYGSE